jgi:hypothetical protein
MNTMQNEPRQTFAVYRWTNPGTTSDYPFLAVPADRSALLSLGNYNVSLDFGLPEEAAHFLAHDFTPTGEELGLELEGLRRLLDATFGGGVELIIVSYDDQLSPCGVQLSLGTPADEAEEGREYTIEGFGSYQRFFRSREQHGPVTLPERFVLDACVSTFAELAAACTELIVEPLPPRYRGPAARLWIPPGRQHEQN